MPITSGDLVQTTSTSSSTGQITLAATASDAFHLPFPAAWNGKTIEYRIQHSTIQSEFERGAGVYTHSGRTLTRPAAAVLHGTAGAGANTNFTAGGLIVSAIQAWSHTERLLHPVEATITGVLTVGADHVAQMLTYTGSGHTWTVNAADGSGTVAVLNNGSGLITVAAGTASITGDTEIGVGATGLIVYSASGTTARVVGTPRGIKTTATALTTNTANRQTLLSTATTQVTFTLDATAPKGAYGAIWQGAVDITVHCAANVEYFQSGDDLTGTGATDDFQVKGYMTWELVDIVGGVRQYIIIGQTSLISSDPVNLAGEVEGVLSEANGGTGATSVAANAAVAQAVSDSAAALAASTGALSRSAGGTVTGDTTFSARLKTQEQVIGYVSRTPGVGGTITVQQDDNGKVYIYGLTITMTVPKTNTLVQVADEVFLTPIFNISASQNVTVTGALGTVVIGPKAYGLLMGLHGGNMILVHQGVMTNIEAPT